MAEPRRFRKPRPNAALMRVLGVANRWLVLRGYFRVTSLEIPPEDLARLRNAVNPGTVTFMGPNHPEFATDWMIDKEISTMVAPLMASWADAGMVRGAPWFWERNNLIANDGGDDARAFSVEWALQGRGVLLHPEGTVHWTNDYVHPLFPGIAQMAISAADRTDKPVFIVPLVWKYHYSADVRPALVKEIGVLERELHLPPSTGDIARRFQALNENLLSARMKHFGFSEASAGGFFERQEAFLDWLVRDLSSRYATEATTDTVKRIARLARAIRGSDSPTRKQDRAMADEAKRLSEFTRAYYDAAELSQEQVGESLKRMRDRLLKRGVRDNLANLLPHPFGPRVVHVGVPDAIRVVAGEGRSVDELLRVTLLAMQTRLDAINAGLASSFRVSNLLRES